MSSIDSVINYQPYQFYELTTAPKTTPTGFFSLPIELRIDIYERVIDVEEYEIHEVGLPALLDTRLQITREFYSLCKLRVVLVKERGWDSEQKRLQRNIENIKSFGTCFDRPDLFVEIRVEKWCRHAALYPERTLRSHGKCRRCRVKGEKGCDIGQVILSLTLVVMSLSFGSCLAVLFVHPSDIERVLLVKYCMDTGAGSTGVCGKAAMAGLQMLADRILSPNPLQLQG